VIDSLSSIAGTIVGDDPLFLENWKNLEEDQYTADGGRYRKRRHASFTTHDATGVSMW